MYQVLARTWRPKDFDGLVGQSHVARTLGNAIAEDRLAHAYIFAGLRGTGKTSVARILAKCLNCATGPTRAPCGTCDPCREIAESRAMDVLEIDAASRTKVDQTRELLEMVAYAPARDRYKILIIDEAHMLSKASFNALLKTLEEPPPNVLFMLATTELEKIIPTIVSRCQVFEFRRVGVKELADHLEHVCRAEGIDVSRPGLERIARAGDGSVRDALSVLERAIAFCGTSVDDEDLLRMLGGVRAETLATLVHGLAARDAAAMLGVLDGLVDQGHDLFHFWSEIVSALRDLLLIRALPDGPDSELLGRSAAEAAALADAATPLSDDDLTRAFRVIADLETALRVSTRPRFIFESALIRLAGLGAVRPIEEVLADLAPGAAPSPSRPVPDRRPRGGAPAPTPEGRSSSHGSRPTAERPPEKKKPRGAGADDDLKASLTAAVLEAKPMAGAILEEAVSVSTTGDTLVVRFEPGAGLSRAFDRDETRGLIEGAARELLGRGVTLRVEEGAAPVGETGAADARPRSSPSETGRAGRGAEGRDTLLKRAKGDPGVRKLLREFGAQVVDIKPLSARPAPEPDGGPAEDA